MNPSHPRHLERSSAQSGPRVPRWLIAFAGGLLVPAALFAQVAPAPSAATKPSAKDQPPMPVVAQKVENEPLELSPFVVTTEQNRGYQAASTLAGTRLNTDLKDVGAAVSVYTQEFLQDINVSKIEDILTYTASTEGGGQNGNFSGITGDSSSAVREDPSSVNRVRALATATRTRDFFPSDIPSDGFSFDTITVSRGPNAILAGVGSAGGVIDSALRKAQFNDSYRFVSRFSSYNSHREEAHLNKVIIPKKLALRVDLLNDDQQFRQNPAYAQDRRVYAAMTYQMIQGSRTGFLGRGTVRANFENGQIEGVPPNPLTPVANLSSWFNDKTGAPLAAPLLKWSVNGATRDILGTDGVTILNSTQQANFVQGFPLYAQWALIYADPTSGAAGVGLTGAGLTGVQTMRQIVFPQAMRLIVPSLGNSVNSLLKTTSITSVISMEELLRRTQELIQERFMVLELFVVAALYYLLMTTVWSYFQRKIEAYYGRGYAAHDAGRAGWRARLAARRAPRTAARSH